MAILPEIGIFRLRLSISSLDNEKNHALSSEIRSIFKHTQIPDLGMDESANRILEILDGKKLIIGREGHVYIGDPSVSKQHAEISISGGKIRLRDLESTNGTFIVRHDEPIRLRDGYVDLHQTIMIGASRQQVRTLLEAVGSISGVAD